MVNYPMASDNIMRDDRNLFNKVAYAIETHKRGVQYGAYSVALVGLAVALRSVRPFKRFTSPAQIPGTFIERQLRLCGRVVRVEPVSGAGAPALIVDHYPVISLRRRGNTDGLAVTIASVDVSNNGVSWLQLVLGGKDVDFTLLKAHGHSVSCIVQHQSRDVGVALVSLGFASVSAIDFGLERNPRYLTYYKRLLQAESRAEKRGVGMWHGEATLAYRILGQVSKPVKAVLARVRDKFVRMKSVLIAT